MQGPHGIIVPMVNSKEEAQDAINAAYYPPKGKRSFGLARAQGYGTKFDEYIVNNQNETVVVVQIEHIDALKDLKNIFSLGEIDAYMIGPYDLSGSMGIPGDFKNSNYLKAIEEIKKTGQKTGTPGGIHIVEPNPNQLKDAAREFSFIAYGVDFRMIDVSCRDGLSILKKENER